MIVLLLLVPCSLVAEWLTGNSLWTFGAGIAAIVPLADWIRRATEALATRLGATIGGLLNVSFGNTAELTLALFVLAAGHGDVVKAQITGSIIGNSLFGLGVAVLAGSIGREQQTFNRDRAGLLSTLMVLSTIALLLPMLFDFTVRRQNAARAASVDEELSLGLAIVLILVYGANLLYTVVTHRDVFAVEPSSPSTSETWSVTRAIAVLVGATIGIAVESYIVSAALETTATTLGLSMRFMGIVVLGVVGNTAEYLAAMSFARADRIGIAIGLTIGSTVQVALLVTPVLVLISWLMGRPMTLVFSDPIEVIAVAAATFVVAAVARDGSTTWFEGLLLVAVYMLFAVAFFLL